MRQVKRLRSRRTGVYFKEVPLRPTQSSQHNQKVKGRAAGVAFQLPSKGRRAPGAPQSKKQPGHQPENRRAHLSGCRVRLLYRLRNSLATSSSFTTACFRTTSSPLPLHVGRLEIAGFESIWCSGTLGINGCSFFSSWAACGCQVQFQFSPDCSALERKCLVEAVEAIIFLIWGRC